MTESSTTEAPKPELTRGTIWARRLIVALFGIVLAMLLMEGLLSFDPVGLRYIRDYKILSDQIIPAAAGYTYAPGVYQLSRSTVTMQEDGTRLVPGSEAVESSPLVFVGDSVTFGLGVSDDQTFVSLIAQVTDNLRVINAGMPAFNITNIRRLVEEQPADARIVYMITDNDADPIFEPSFDPADRLPDMPWTALYIRFLPTVIQATDPNYGNAGTDIDFYVREVQPLTEDSRVLIVGYDTALTPITEGAIQIEPYSTRLSFADKHPDANGHRQLAAQVLTALEERFDLTPSPSP